MKNSYHSLQEKIRGLKRPKIDRWKNKYADKNYKVFLRTEEFTCICPKTGLPDYAVINIEYIPDLYCVELKSFKLYLASYRNVGVFHEHVVNKILDDFITSCKPRYAKVTGEFNMRGGIKTTVERVYEKDKN